MLIGIIEIILIVATLLAAIIGTISNPSARVKAMIIGLAVVMSIGSVIEVQEAARRSEEAARKGKIDERLIATLIHASNPPEYFSHEFVKAANRILENSDQFVTSQTVSEDNGERILTIKPEVDTENSGVLFFSRENMNPIYYEHVVGGDITNSISIHMDKSWSDCINQWNECFSELAALSKAAMEIAPITVYETAAQMNEDLTFSLSSAETYGGNHIRIEFDKAFIESLYQLPPGKRGLRILTTGQEQVIDQL